MTSSGLNKITVLIDTTESLEVGFRHGVIRVPDLLSLGLSPLMGPRCLPEKLS